MKTPDHERLLDRVRQLADRSGICESCGNLVFITERLVGCEARDKLIIPEYPPYHNTNNKCPEWSKRVEKGIGHDQG